MKRLPHQHRRRNLEAVCPEGFGRWLPGYEGIYSLTPDGSVYSHLGKSPRSLSIRNGSVDLHSDVGENTLRKVSRLVAIVYGEAGKLQEDERWVPGYVDNYSYNSSGAVFSHKRGKKQLKITDGHFTASYSALDKETYLIKDLPPIV